MFKPKIKHVLRAAAATFSVKAVWLLYWYFFAEVWPEAERTADENEKFFWWYRRGE